MSCYYKVSSLNISAFTYAFFLLGSCCTDVLGSYCRLARVRFAWLRNSREDLFQSTSVTLRRHGRSTNRLLRVSGIYTVYPEWANCMEIPIPVSRDLFLIPGHDHPSTSAEIFSTSHRIPQTFHVTVQCFNTVLCEIYCDLVYKFLVTFSAILRVLRKYLS